MGHLPTWALYLLTIFAWGTSWYGIALHLEHAPLMQSIGYRFVLAGLILFAFVWLRDKTIRVPRPLIKLIALQLVCLFALNYWLFYRAQLYIPSAFAAIAFSGVIIANAINNRLLRKQATGWRVITGGVFGITGLALVFSSQLAGFRLDDMVFMGLMLALAGTWVASIGNVGAAMMSDRGGKLVLTNAWGMFLGGTLTLLLHAALGGTFSLPNDAVYWGAIIYLVLVSSIIGFGSYLTLISRQGPARAAYVSVLFPLVALIFSVLFEGVAVTYELIFGLGLVVLGNVFILQRKAK